MTLSIQKRTRSLVKVAAAALFCSATAGALAQTVTGSFTPSTVAPSSASSLSLTYTAFTSDSSGMNLRLYYNSAAVTIGAVTYSNPPGSSQSAAVAVPGTLASCAGADQYITLNWADINGTWPTPAAGALASVGVTTTAAFAAPTLVCWEDDIDNGAVERNITGSATLNPTVSATPSVSVAASPATLADSAANVSTVTFTSSAAAPAGGLSVVITPPAAGGLIASTTCASPISIAAGATTATCTVTAAVNAVPGDGPTVGTITVGAGTGYTVGAPASATVTVNNDDVAPGTPAVSVAVTPATLVDAAANVATVTFTSSLAAPAGGLSVAITPPTVAGLIASTTCASPISIAAGATTATCTITAAANTTPGDGPTSGVTTVLAGAGYSVGAPASATVTVNNDDAVPAVPAVFVTAAPTVIGDSGGVITLTFTATIAPAAALTVNITPPTAGGLIASTTCGATVTITPPATTATCTVTAAANTVVGEAPSTSAATVLAGTGYTIGDLPTANVTVTDDDGVPVVATAVPTMGVFSLGLMGLLVAGFAGFAQRRRLVK
jgi:hypothetical protein